MSENPVIVEHSQAITKTYSEVTHETYPVAAAEKAYKMFMLDGRTPKDIAEATQIPQVVIEEWSKKMGWSIRRMQYAQESIRVLNAEAGRVQADSRLETIRNQIKKAREVVEKAHSMAMEAATSNQLKAATEAMASAATMEARAVGLAEKTVQKDVESDDQRPNKSAMVFIGLGALPPSALGESRVIETPSEEKSPAAEAPCEGC